MDITCFTAWPACILQSDRPVQSEHRTTLATKAEFRATLRAARAMLRQPRNRNMPQAPATTIKDRGELLDYMASGCRPADRWRLGTEHEKFGFTRDDLRPLPYDGARSIRALLEGLAHRHGWTPVLEDGLPIALLEDWERPSRWSPAASWSCPARCWTACTTPAAK
jgi:hypothetical protein